jgi:hypothetical protein
MLSGWMSPLVRGLRTYGIQARRLCVGGSAREGLTLNLQLEPICRWVLLTEKGLDITREAFPEPRCRRYW